MTDKAMEALETLNTEIFMPTDESDAEHKEAYNIIRLALLELSAIKKTMQEWLESKDWSESLAWETLHKIDYIIKGEEK